jgi:hypothetical protein
MDLSIVDKPSVRFEIEIIFRTLENSVEHYLSLIDQDYTDPAVIRFVADKWSTLQINLGRIACIGGQNQLVEGRIPTQEQQPIPLDSYAFSQSHFVPDPAIPDTSFSDFSKILHLTEILKQARHTPGTCASSSDLLKYSDPLIGMWNRILQGTGLWEKVVLCAL